MDEFAGNLHFCGNCADCGRLVHRMPGHCLYCGAGVPLLQDVDSWLEEEDREERKEVIRSAVISVLLLLSLVPWFLLLLNAWVTTTLFSGLVDWLGG